MAVPPYEMPEWQQRFQDLSAFQRVRNAERDYGRRLRQLARNIETMVRSYVEAHRDEAEIQQVLGGYTAPHDLAGLASMLDRYSAILDPWAQSVALRFVVEVARRDQAAWATYAKTMSRALQQEIQTAPTGEMLHRALAEQVSLIKSIPEEAAKRVHEIAVGNLYGGERYGGLINIIMDQGRVSRNKAALIARTETARVSSMLTQVRARHVGSEGYIWRTVRDRRVRKSHKDMEGKFIRWDDPPVVDQGVPPYHAGQIWNCFPGNTTVDWSLARRLFRAPYNGQLVCLKVGLDIIDLTPNHPVLTAKGWKAAGALDNTDYVICRSLKGVERSDDYVNKYVTTFDDLFESLRADISQRVPQTCFNFYGDIPDGDVDEITIDLNLLSNRNLSVLDDRGEFPFPSTDSRIVERRIGSGLDHISESPFPSSLNIGEMLLLGLIGGDNLVGEQAIAHFDAIAQQQVADGHARDAILLGESWNAQAATVQTNDFIVRERQRAPLGAGLLPFDSIDSKDAQFLAENVGAAADFVGSVDERASASYQLCRVQNKTFRDFSGHVYTLETWSGVYSVGASRMQVKNCRCFAQPIMPDRYPLAA